MNTLSRLLLVAPLGFIGCADAVDTGSAKLDGAPQQLDLQAGKLDGAAAKSTDARLLNCQLEYESFAPTFTIKTAASFETTFGNVENTGMAASDGAFSLNVETNPNPPYNLSFIAQIFDEAHGAGLSYIVLPRPHVGGAFLFELGASISSVTLSDGLAYDHLRAYCSIRNP